MSAGLAGGTRLWAAVTDRTYRVLSVDAETDTARGASTRAVPVSALTESTR